MEKVEQGVVVKVFEREIWIESDIMGSKHIMIQHMDGESPPIKYCTFFYNYAITSNGAIREQAERMAIQLGAKEPVEYREHDMSEMIKKLEEHGEKTIMSQFGDALKAAMVAEPDIMYLGNMEDKDKNNLMKADTETLYIGKNKSGSFDISQIKFGKTVVHTVHTFSSLVAMHVAAYVHNLKKVDPVKAEWAKQVLSNDHRAELPRGFPAYSPCKIPQ